MLIEEKNKIKSVIEEILSCETIKNKYTSTDILLDKIEMKCNSDDVFQHSFNTYLECAKKNDMDGRYDCYYHLKSSVLVDEFFFNDKTNQENKLEKIVKRIFSRLEIIRKYPSINSLLGDIHAKCSSDIIFQRAFTEAIDSNFRIKNVLEEYFF
jgi:hypothetical protein